MGAGGAREAGPTPPPLASPQRRYARFAGGVFHDLVGTWRLKFGAGDAGPGVLMSFASPGSTFATLVAKTATAAVTSADASKRVILSLNGEEMTSLDALIKAAKGVEDGSTGYAVARTPNVVARPSGQAVKLTYNTRIDPLKVFVWRDDARAWVEET